MKFNSEKVAFGRHETFALRYRWLTKGFQALAKNPGIFESNDATVELGVGKNMVLSIRYWLRACQMIKPSVAEPTEIGSLILDEAKGFDPYLEDEATIWLIHWLLATSPQLATSWYWFFNKYHKPEFTGQELTTALSDFIKENVVKNKRPAMATIKNDAQLLHRMYTQSKGNTRMPLEEALDSPLSLLRLVTQTAGGRSFQSKLESRSGLPLGVLGFAVVQLLEQRNVVAIPIEELMHSRDEYPAPGAVFRLTENDLITKLESLVNYLPGVFEIRETAGIHQLYQTRNCSPNVFLEKHYADVVEGVAA
jgi:Protein of unknown function (DUF4007)